MSFTLLFGTFHLLHLPGQISEDIQRKRLAEQDSSMTSSQRVNPQHSVAAANPAVMEGQSQPPLAAGNKEEDAY